MHKLKPLSYFLRTNVSKAHVKTLIIESGEYSMLDSAADETFFETKVVDRASVTSVKNKYATTQNFDHQVVKGLTLIREIVKLLLYYFDKNSDTSKILQNFLYLFLRKLNYFFTITIQFSDSSIPNGSAVMNLKVNEKPFNGSCISEPTQGFALLTNFTIRCSGWTDNDGYI
ncbi:hypothetical protein BpHYR1_021088, partial [Brachionus plicatilis]